MFINSILHSRSADYSTKSWLLFQNTEAIAIVACISPKQLMGQSALTTQKTCDKTYVYRGSRVDGIFGCTQVDGNGGLHSSCRDLCVVRECHLCVPEKPGWFQRERERERERETHKSHLLFTALRFLLFAPC